MTEHGDPTLLTDCRSLLNAMQYLFRELEEKKRAGHLEERCRDLVRRLDAAIPETFQESGADGDLG